LKPPRNGFKSVNFFDLKVAINDGLLIFIPKKPKLTLARYNLMIVRSILKLKPGLSLSEFS